MTGVANDDETGVSYSYDALGRKVTREETMWTAQQPQGNASGLQKDPAAQGNAWGLQKEPGEKAAPATEGKGSGNGKSPEGKGNGKSVGNGGQVVTSPNYVLVKHSDGTYTLYAHLEESLSVDMGDTVVAGQQLGTVGLTGRTTGAHLHLELRDLTWNLVDPTEALPLREQ